MLIYVVWLSLVGDVLRICDELRDEVLPDLGVCLEDKEGM